MCSSDLATGGAPLNAVATPSTSGVNFTLGQSTANPAILAMEDALLAKNAGGVLGTVHQGNRTVLADNLRGLAQDEIARDAAVAARESTAGALYKSALDPANQQPLTPWIKGQITQLIKRPSINDASKQAQRWAIERGEKPSSMGSLQALHDVKIALDDQIAAAMSQGQKGHAASLQNTRDQLLTVIEKISPDYQAARTTYAGMSQPIKIGRAHV